MEEKFRSVTALWLAARIENTVLRDVTALKASLCLVRASLLQLCLEKHYSGNKVRNAIVREDFPMAKDAQQRAQDEAMAEYYRQTKLLEEEDERIAREIAERLEREEAEKLRRLEVEDQRMARIMQERDKRAKLLAKQGDINAVGLPLPSSVLPDGAYGGVAHQQVTRGVDARLYENVPPPLPSHHRGRRTMVDVEQQFRRMQMDDDVAEPIWPPPPDPDQITKANQEKSDEVSELLQVQEYTILFIGILVR
ncbi:hypothetical protein GE061_008374 [Apolygus lucorum]|uniref:Coiled-coil domain-containing protein n=1 Tax=Apolygus lucorum TaxID=248454 RepID=A0A8S9WPF7_APOLU|nr:hypothetical protein GE061_008374 [Apolygus lucorum]